MNKWYENYYSEEATKIRQPYCDPRFENCTGLPAPVPELVPVPSTIIIPTEEEDEDPWSFNEEPDVSDEEFFGGNDDPVSIPVVTPPSIPQPQPQPLPDIDNNFMNNGEEEDIGANGEEEDIGADFI